MIRNFASRTEKTLLRNDYVVIFFCGSKNKRLSSHKNVLIIFPEGGNTKSAINEPH